MNNYKDEKVVDRLPEYLPILKKIRRLKLEIVNEGRRRGIVFDKPYYWNEHYNAREMESSDTVGQSRYDRDHPSGAHRKQYYHS
jgi:hypothetical protein